MSTEHDQEELSNNAYQVYRDMRDVADEDHMLFLICRAQRHYHEFMAREAQPEQRVRLNINANVHAKLTDHGLAILEQERQRYKLYGVAMFPQRADGRHSFSLWEFMQIFGPHMGLTLEPVCEMDVYLNEFQLEAK